MYSGQVELVLLYKGLSIKDARNHADGLSSADKGRGCSSEADVALFGTKTFK